MPERPAGKRGMKEWQPEKVKLRLGDYMKPDLPPLRKAPFGHIGNRPPGGLSSWLMLANNKYGCCVLSGAGHEHMTLAAATGRPLPSFNDDVIANQYLKLTGDKDTGLDPLEVAKWRMQTGLRDAKGGIHKIDGFVMLDSLKELDYAIAFLGVAAIGLMLPDSCERQFSQHHVWDDTSGQPSGGHYVPLVQHNSKGERVCITWGGLQAMTDAYINKYMMGGLGYIIPEYINVKSGETPEGLNLAKLQEDANSISNITQ